MPDILPNEILFNRFRIEECLKKDHMSNVYTAWHIHLDKKILLKTLNAEEIGDHGWLERFRREAKVLAHLDHPNIIRILDFGSENNIYYISFEYFESENLRHLLKYESLNHDQKQQIFVQLLQGLHAAHHHGIIHRDIKPENILVNDQYQLKLADFGLAFRAEDSKLTRDTSVVGTPAYMSPEQIRGEKLTVKTDLFSVGIVAFELFQGFHPFLGEDAKSTINNILNLDHQQINKKLTTDDPAVIIQLLHPSPEHRPSSVSVVLKELGIVFDKNRIDKADKKKSKKLYFRYAITASIIILLALSSYIFYPDFNVMPDVDPENSSILIDSTNTVRQDNIQTKEEILPEKAQKKIKIYETVNEAPALPDSGTLFVFSEPASDVYLDRQHLGKTPFRQAMKIASGTHHLKLIHEHYPTYNEEISIQPGQAIIKGFSLDTLFGYLTCQAYPWAMILVDGKLIGETPLSKPVLLAPGKHVLTIENPGYQTLTDSVVIARRDTTVYRVNLDKKSGTRFLE